MKPKQEVETRPSENQNQNEVEQSKSSDKRSSQSQSVKLTEEDLPDLKDPEVQKATSLIQVPTYNCPYQFGNIYWWSTHNVDRCD